MLIKIGGKYRLKDGGTIAVHSRCLTDTTDAMRCTTETGEVVFYDQHGRILPLDGSKELARYNVEPARSHPAPRWQQGTGKVQRGADHQ